MDNPAPETGQAEVPVPDTVRRVVGGEPLNLVWHNAVGGLTFETGSGPHRRFVKWAPEGSELYLAAEAERLTWAFPYTPVPRLLSQGQDDSGMWLVTAALPGRNAVDQRWRREPATAVRAIGEGLRAMHEALPAPDGP